MNNTKEIALPRVNGGLNWNVKKEDFETYTDEQKKELARLSILDIRNSYPAYDNVKADDYNGARDVYETAKRVKFFKDEERVKAQKQKGKDLQKIIFEYSLHHNIELPFWEVMGYVEGIGQYNDFTSMNVKNMLTNIYDIVGFGRMNYGANNCNTGGQSMKIKIGRESSPCIYISGFVGKETTAKELKTLIEKYAKEAEADEITFEDTTAYSSDYIEARLRWD